MIKVQMTIIIIAYEAKGITITWNAIIYRERKIIAHDERYVPKGINR